MKVCTVEFYSDFQDRRWILGVYTDVNRAIVGMIRAYVADQGQANAVIRHFEVDSPDPLVSIEYNFGHQDAHTWAERVLKIESHTKLEELTDKEVLRRFFEHLK